MRVLIVGLGSIGRRHLRHMKILDPQGEIAVLRSFSRNTDLGELAPLVQQTFVDQEDALAWRPDAVLITNPAPLHIPTALAFAGVGSHLFIEKPLAAGTTGLDEFAAECRGRNLTVMVAYVLRFLEPLRLLRRSILDGKIGRVLNIRASVGRYLGDWRPGTDYRSNVSARRELGGGVLLELSHELDYVRWLAGEICAVQALAGKVSDLEMDVEDIAEVNLAFVNGAVGHVHLDMLDRAPHRFCRVAGSEGTLTWDFFDGNRVRWYGPAGKSEEIYHNPSLDYNQMFIAELSHFLECIVGRTEPAVGLPDGQRIVEVILAARRSYVEGRTITV